MKRIGILLFISALIIGATTVTTTGLEIQLSPTAPHQHALTAVVTAIDPSLTNNVALDAIEYSPWNSAIYGSCNAYGRGCIKATHVLDPNDPSAGVNAAALSLTVTGTGNQARLLFVRPEAGTAGNYAVVRTAPDRPIQRDVLLLHQSDRVGIGVNANRQPVGRVEVVQGVAGEAATPGLVIRAAPGSTAPVLRILSDAGTLDLMPDFTWIRH